MTDRKPGEDLGIGWGVAEDSQTDAMGVGDARDWNDADKGESVENEPEAPGEAEDDNAPNEGGGSK